MMPGSFHGTRANGTTEVVDSALNLEAHGQVVFKAMAEGTDGSGSRMAVRYANGSGTGSVHSSAKMLLVDNALVKMGMRIVGRQLAPSDAVVGDAVGLIQHWVRDLDADYLEARPRLELGGA